ncbi:UDP-galactose transporter, putative [Ixodes scapularis]|uniref:UDP-galactose transporter, putative n=1 Tax=Ixodes scapularis TaxID=6945 RepID=B7PG88_IXOSC|nr:UDP-galactose transporter, putative [Ixodes scapularis]|eukprot:XP_002434210.1 UDP-galactose transporter, putative [Ixodes scapularis]
MPGVDSLQVVGKSCKPIPVMVLGVLIGGKRYSLSKYLSILVVVLGVGLFIYKDKKASQTTQSITGTGELLLVRMRAPPSVAQAEGYLGSF